MVYLFLSLFVCLEIHAGEWWKLPRTEDKDYLYYVGSAEGKASFTALQEEAFGKAMSEVVREHFGMAIQISENSVQDLNSDSYQVVTKQSSSPISMKGVSLTHTYETESSGRRRIYIQIRVTKEKLQKAVDAYSLVPQSEKFNTYGDPHGTKTSVKIKTNPSGALITLTHLDQRYSIQGHGDAHIFVPQGRYQMVVSAPGHMAMTRELIIQADGREEFITLDQLHTKLQVSIEPEDARIHFNGKEVESSAFKLPIGRVHKFRFTHPDYLSQEIEIATQVPEIVVKKINLEPKMSTLRFVVTPSNASIEIDGEEVTPYDGKIMVTPGRKRVRIFRKHYFDHSEVIDVGPNRDLAPRYIYLKLDEENTSPSELGLSGRIEINPFTLQGEYGRGHMIPVALHVEWIYFSLGVGRLHTSEEGEKKDDMQNVWKTQKTYNDFYGSARLMTPKMEDIKLFASYTTGSINQSYKYSKVEKVQKSSKTYNGFGGGARFYFGRNWSMQVEYFRTKSELKREKEVIKKEEDRIIAGFSYEF